MLARIEASAAFNAFRRSAQSRHWRRRPARKSAGAQARRWVRSTGCRRRSRTISGSRAIRPGAARRTGDLTTAAEADAPASRGCASRARSLSARPRLPEYGWIGACHSPLTGITRNPWNPAHTPGGSTGGGAVAALLGLGVLHLGTDGAGSVAHSGGLYRRVRLQAELRPRAGLSAVTVPRAGAPGADCAVRRRCRADAVGDLGARCARHEQHGIRRPRISPPGSTVACGACASPFRRGSAAAPHRKRDRSGGGQGGAGAGRAGRHGGGGRSAARRRLETIQALWWPGAAAIVDSMPGAKHAEMDPGLLAIAERGRRFTVSDYLAAYYETQRILRLPCCAFTSVTICW